ncbi:MAG: peptidoglycan DD-metalloendopeptidase family protein [Chlorobium sp.]|nr:peptidoglycan DD-metalloendopeptidase family protein [Chlorobium sp.]MCW8815908.1 peptidoglycan DD-metalloendopeptidase family protein [Chlorobium sp.]MCW8819685.1 peptidoglycan DD-metalloendopeptidase family protein [Ignavibacteriaceae bacterium]
MKAHNRSLGKERPRLEKALTLLIILISLSLAPLSTALGNPEIDKIMKERKKLEKDLSSLKTQLNEYQTKLKKTTKEEARSMQALKNYNRQLKLLEEMIAKNNAKLRSQDSEIKLLKEQFVDNQSRYEAIVEEFRRIAVGVYKSGSKHDIELLFSATSLNQAIVRSRYIGFLSEAVISIVDDLQSTSRKLDASRKALEVSYQKRTGIVKEQQGQVQSFSKKKDEKQSVLIALKKDKKKFSGEIQANRKKLLKLQGKIEELIRAEQIAIEKEKERKRLEAERRKLEGKVPVPDTSEADLARISEDFDKALGILPWPVENGVVVRKFGRINDPDLNIVTTNNGIDISVSSGVPVRAVSGGKIAQIAYLPTYGNIVIIRHSKSYLTVYANLAKINVAKDDVVAAREIIGVAGSMPEGGSLVHFEVWKGKVKQNPQKWLKK